MRDGYRILRGESNAHLADLVQVHDQALAAFQADVARPWTDGHSDLKCFELITNEVHHLSCAADPSQKPRYQSIRNAAVNAQLGLTPTLVGHLKAMLRLALGVKFLAEPFLMVSVPESGEQWFHTDGERNQDTWPRAGASQKDLGLVERVILLALSPYHLGVLLGSHRGRVLEGTPVDYPRLAQGDILEMFGVTTHRGTTPPDGAAYQMVIHFVAGPASVLRYDGGEFQLERYPFASQQDHAALPRVGYDEDSLMGMMYMQIAGSSEVRLYTRAQYATATRNKDGATCPHHSWFSSYKVGVRVTLPAETALWTSQPNEWRSTPGSGAGSTALMNWPLLPHQTPMPLGPSTANPRPAPRPVLCSRLGCPHRPFPCPPPSRPQSLRRRCAEYVRPRDPARRRGARSARAK
jgi:hypothetical protein